MGITIYFSMHKVSLLETRQITERGGESVILNFLIFFNNSAVSKHISINEHESRNEINTHNTGIFTWKTLLREKLRGD